MIFQSFLLLLSKSSHETFLYVNSGCLFLLIEKSRQDTDMAFPLCEPSCVLPTSSSCYISYHRYCMGIKIFLCACFRTFFFGFCSDGFSHIQGKDIAFHFYGPMRCGP